MSVRAESAKRPAGPGPSALAAAGAVAGWVLHDAAMFLATAEPALALELVPRSLAALVGAAVLGALLGLHRRLAPLAALALGAFALTLRFAPGVAGRVPQDAAWLVHVALLFVLALVLALGASVRMRLGLLRASLTLGVLACAVLALAHAPDQEPAWPVLAGAVVLFALGLVPRAGLRAGLTALVCVLAAAPVARLAAAGASLERADLEPAAGGSTHTPNLLLVVLDTVRADHLAPYGYERVTTPRLDAFVADEATLYARAHSTSSWTLPSHASLFTGLLPAVHGATHPRGELEDGNTVNAARVPAQRLRPDVETVAELLRAAGYRTGAVLGNAAFLDHRFGLDRGFEHYDARPGGKVGDYRALAQLLGLREQAGQLPYRHAETITDLALAWLERSADGRPFFLTLNYMDAHTPYAPPAETAGRLGAPLAAEPVELYDRELLWIDEHLTRLFDELRARGTFDDTVIVVTSDHGEAHGEHGIPGHNWHLYEELVHVPLYVKPAGARERARHDEPVAGTDVFGLALRSVGLEPPARPEATVDSEWYDMKGVPIPRSIGVARDVVSWFESGRKVIVTSLEHVEAYDLARDPKELAPLALSADEAAAAVQRAKDWWEQNPPPAADDVELSEEDLERLHELGYLGGDE